MSYIVVLFCVYPAPFQYFIYLLAKNREKIERKISKMHVILLKSYGDAKITQYSECLLRNGFVN